MTVPPNTWNRLAAVLFIAFALSLVRCASPPPPAPPPPPPLRPSVFELDGLTMNQDFVVEDRRPLVLYFDVPQGRILEIDVDPPSDFDGRYTVRSVLRDELMEWDRLDRPARVRRPGLKSGRYELKIVTKDTSPQRLSIRLRMPLPAAPPPPPPPPPPPQKEKGTKKGTDRSTSPKHREPAPAPAKCAKISGDAERVADGQTTNGLFTQKGRSQQRWFTFRLRKRAPVTVELTMRNKHRVAIAILDANGCSKKQATKVHELARLKTTLDAGAYFIRVSTDVQRSRNVHFRVRMDIEGQDPKKPVLPRPQSAPPPPPSPVLRCTDVSVPASGEWIVVLDPIAPNDPPTRLRLQLSRAGTEVHPLPVPDRQPCLIVNRYRLDAGRYTACAITTDTSYRPNVSLKAEAANPRRAPYVEVLRDCER